MDSPPHFFTGPDTRIVEQFFDDKYIFPANFQFVDNKVKKWYIYQQLDNGAQMTSSWNNCICEVLKLWVIIDNLAIYDCGNIYSKIRQCSTNDIWNHLGEFISILIGIKICLKDWNLIMLEHISKRRQFWLRAALLDK